MTVTAINEKVLGGKFNMCDQCGHYTWAHNESGCTATVVDKDAPDYKDVYRWKNCDCTAITQQ